ncbi:MAG: histidine phosphatase family protein [Chloroflexi bacterium]|nr:histidine phosphatase family protein [Chloroflexota bacterium]
MASPASGPHLTRLYLLRHGESRWNQEGRYQGRLDPELSPLGRRQGRALARHLRGLPLEALYSSPQRRAWDTAALVARGRALTPQSLEELRELDHGEWNGKLWTEAQAAYPELWAQWLAHPERVTMPGGESLEEVRRRTRRVLKLVRERHPREHVALCSHNAVLKVVALDLLGLPLSHFWRLDLDSGSQTAFELRPRPRLLLLNDTCHLGRWRSPPERSL